MKKYVSPVVEKVAFVSDESIAAYVACEAVNWLTGDAAGDFFCPTSEPNQINHDYSCYNGPSA